MQATELRFAAVEEGAVVSKAGALDMEELAQGAGDRLLECGSDVAEGTERAELASRRRWRDDDGCCCCWSC